MKKLRIVDIEDVIEENRNNFISHVVKMNWGNEYIDRPSYRPNRKALSREDFLTEWGGLIDDGRTLEKRFFPEFVKETKQYSLRELEVAFEWVYVHFYEFCFGDGGWYGCIFRILDHISEKPNKKMTFRFERELKYNSIAGEDKLLEGNCWL